MLRRLSMKHISKRTIALLIILPISSAFCMKPTVKGNAKATRPSMTTSADVVALVNDSAEPVKVSIGTLERKHSFTLQPKQTFNLEDKVKLGFVTSLKINDKDMTKQLHEQRSKLNKSSVRLAVTKDTFKIK